MWQQLLHLPCALSLPDATQGWGASLLTTPCILGGYEKTSPSVVLQILALVSSDALGCCCFDLSFAYF